MLTLFKQHKKINNKIFKHKIRPFKLESDGCAKLCKFH